MAHEIRAQDPGTSRDNGSRGGLPAAMPVPVTAGGCAGLAALLGAPYAALIAVDFDGTLAPIVADPAQARALPAAVDALAALTPLVGTIAVLTGRPALTAVAFGSLDRVPGIIVLGHYGRQRWQDGILHSPPPPEGLAVARERLAGVLSGADAAEGTWVEDKADSVAVHTRRASDPAAALERIRAPLLRLAAQTGLRAEPGRFVIELRPPGADKGIALEDLAAQRDPSAIMYCGDDLGDRPAFRAVRTMRAAGRPGIAVCSASAEVADLAREVDLVVAGPEGIAALLAALAVQIGRDGS